MRLQRIWNRPPLRYRNCFASTTVCWWLISHPACVPNRRRRKWRRKKAYVRLLQLQEPDRPSLLRAYLFKTATNLAIDRLRHRTIQHRAQEQPELFEDLNTTSGELDDPAKQLLAREQAGRLLGFLQELPVKCLQVIDLHRVEGLPQHEVAARVGISERMVRRYVTYAIIYCHLRLDGMAADQVRQRVSL